MPSPTTEDLRDFAERVERLCQFLLTKTNQTEMNSDDVAVIRKLKEDAADFQNVRIDAFYHGLDNYLRGFPQT